MTISPDTTDLALEGVSLAWPGLPVLDHIDLSVPKGKILSVIGPSGCGKSTLLKVAGGLLPPTSGRVMFHGQDISGVPQGFGLMNQKDLLFPWLPLWKNVGLPLRLQGASWKSIKPRVLGLLEEFSLGNFAQYYPFQLSGGMRQRGAFLRAVLTGSPVLLLDEPFGALDALTRRELQLWLYNGWSTHRTTVLLVTHSLEEALLLSHQVVVLTGIPGKIQALHTLEFAEAPLEEKLRLPEFLRERTELESSLRTGFRG